MPRIRTLSLGLTVSFIAITAASAQLGTLPLPAEAFRKAQARQAAPLPQARPVKRAVASFWTSSEPTFDEGTYDRINAAMLSYSAMEVRGGWPLVAKVNLEPGAKGSDVAKLRICGLAGCRQKKFYEHFIGTVHLLH